MRRILPLLVLLTLGACSSDSGESPTGPDDDDPVGDDDPVATDVWLSVFGGGDSDAMEAVILTEDGGYLISGTTLSSGEGAGDAWIIRVEEDGSVAWQRTYGGAGYDMAYDLHETADGGFVAAGLTESFSVGGQDVWVFKLDASGDVEWERSYGGTGQEQAWSVDILPGGDIVVAGGTTSFGAGGSDLLVMRLDPTGEIVWQRAYGGSQDDAPGGEYDEHVARAFVDGSGDIVASTVTYSFGAGDSDVWVLKLDADGGILWENAYGDADADGMWMAGEHVGGGYFVPGYFTPTDDYETDLWGLSLNTDGSIAWQKTFGLEGTYDEALSVGMTADGGALIGGSYYEEGDTDWSWTLTRVSADGALDWARRYERGFDWPNAIVELPDGKFVVAGVTMTSLSDQEDLMLMKTAADGSVGGSCTMVVDHGVSEEVTAASAVPSAAVVTVTDMEAVDTDAVTGVSGQDPNTLCSG